MIVQLLLIREKQKKMADDNKEVEDPARSSLEKILTKFLTDRFKEILDAKYKYFRWRP